MKHSQRSKFGFFGLLAVMAFALSLAAFAADTHSANFTLNDTVQLGSTQLTPGDYKAQWSGSADSLKVEILRHGKTVATADAKILNMNHPSPYSAVTLKPTANNGKTLDQIQFNNRTEALVFTGEPRAAGE